MSRDQVNVPVLALVGDAGRGRTRRVAGRIALHPGDHDVVTFLNVRDILAGRVHYSGRFVPEYQGQTRVRPIQLVEL